MIFRSSFGLFCVSIGERRLSVFFLLFMIKPCERSYSFLIVNMVQLIGIVFPLFVKKAEKHEKNVFDWLANTLYF